MLNIRSSRVDNQNPNFCNTARKNGEDNLAWLGRVGAFKGKTTRLLLFGGRDNVNFRLRVAQSHMRADMTPSHWSHVVMLDDTAKAHKNTKTIEISLQPKQGFGFAAANNGIQNGTIEDYFDAQAYPNIALLHLPASVGNPTEVSDALDQFKKQRVVLDATELILTWLAFVWGVGQSPNPLLSGHGIPSAAMLESVISALGYDLTPGLESRASSPEAIWQAARWWHEFHEEAQQGALKGHWHHEHRLPYGY